MVINGETTVNLKTLENSNMTFQQVFPRAAAWIVSHCAFDGAASFDVD